MSPHILITQKRIDREIVNGYFTWKWSLVEQIVWVMQSIIYFASDKLSFILKDEIIQKIFLLIVNAQK